MLPSIGAVLLAGSAFVAAQTFDPQLVGTWSSKSNSTFTGPGFYDSVNEKFNEPAHTGISYSFTQDGYYEESYYRAIANPTNPACPQGMMQWQHGSYQRPANGSLILSPIAVDGRELTSDPCNNKNGIYMRYNQSELFERYEVLTDPYHNIPRLNLYRFDGSPMIPMYLVYSPPLMLPTTTLHPATTATGKAKSSKFKRGLSGEEINALPNHKILGTMKEPLDANKWWWFGVAATGLGGFLFFCF